MNVVVFCGAGFSVGAGLPTMASFNAAVERCPSLQNGQKADYQEIVRRCSSTGLVAGVSTRNLEDLVSILEVLNMTGSPMEISASSKGTAKAALDVVRTCIAHVCHPQSHQNRTNCAPFIEVLARHCKSVCFITTNYDLNIELGAAALGVKVVSSGFDPKWLQSTSTRQHSLYNVPRNRNMGDFDKSIRLCKLHGSVNWFAAGDSFLIDDVYSVNESHNPYHYFAELALKAPGAESLPELVAPSFFKTFGNCLLAAQWTAAAEALRSAHVVAIIGYSFPPSDRMMRYFFASALEQNTSLMRIVLIDPQCGQILSGNSEFFQSPRISSLVQAYPCPWDWTTDNIVEILDGRFDVDVRIELIRRIDARSKGREAIQRSLKMS